MSPFSCPEDSVIDFPVEEYQGRLDRAQALMEQHGLDALLVTTEGNVRYFTGHRSHRWYQSTAPQFALIPRTGRPVLLAPGIETGRAQHNPWIGELRTFSSYERIGVAELAQAVRDLGLERGRIGAELGLGFHLGMPHDDFRTFLGMVPSAAVVDATEVFWGLRIPKSSAEVDCLREALRVTHVAMGKLHEGTRDGMTERQLCSIFVQAVMAEGADWPGSNPLGSRAPGTTFSQDAHLRLATDRAVREGDIVWIDAGCIVKGYWSDTLRMFCLGKAPQIWRDAYAFVYEATQAAIAAAQPGRPIGDTVAAVESKMRASPYASLADRLKKARIGHGVGLDLTEPPSMSYDDGTILKPGTVLTIEPSIYLPEIGFFMIEEDVLITESGNQILSTPMPPMLPEVTG